MAQNFARHSLDVLNELALRTCNRSNNCPLRKKSKLRAAKKQTPNQYSICVYIYIYIYTWYTCIPVLEASVIFSIYKQQIQQKKPSIVFEFHHNLSAPHLSPPHQDFPTYERACFCKADSGLFNRCGKEPLQVVEFCDTNLRDQPKNLVGWLDFSKWRIPVEFVLLHNTWWFQKSEKTPWHLNNKNWLSGGYSPTMWFPVSSFARAMLQPKKGCDPTRQWCDPRGPWSSREKNRAIWGEFAQVANMNYIVIVWRIPLLTRAVYCEVSRNCELVCPKHTVYK